MKITKISILNFLGISSFQASKLGKLNRIEGSNGVGKTAVLKAITEAIRSSGVNPNLIKTGSDKAEILIEIDNNISIERKITHTANNPKVVVNGEPINKPQKYLNDLIGPFNFNPVEFIQAKAKPRRDMLLSSIDFYINQDVLSEALGPLSDPIDLDKYDYSEHGLVLLEEIKKEVYDRRREANVELTRLKNSIKQDKLDIPDNFNQEKFENFDLGVKAEELSAANVLISDNGHNVEKRDALREKVKSIKIRIAEMENNIKQLTDELKDTQTQGKALAEEINNFEKPDTSQLSDDINEFKSSQKLIHKIDGIKEKETSVISVQDDHKSLDTLHQALSNDIPRRMLAQVDLPVKGLEIRGDDIFIDGVSIDTLSTSEQIKFSVAIAKSLAGKLKVICVDRFESLDKTSQKVFIKETGKDEFEYFMTVVKEGDLNMISSNKNKSESVATGTFDAPGF